MAPLFKTSLALAATTLYAGVAGATLMSLPLEQSQNEVDQVQHAQHAVNRYCTKPGAGVPVAPEVLDGGFWFGRFDIGDAKNLSCLIDTGSFDVGLNPGYYKPSSSSKKLGAGGNYAYLTVLENGCGTSNISYQGYNDSVSFQGLAVEHQGLYYIQKKKAKPGVATQLYQAGIVGFSSDASDEFGEPFFWSLCKNKQVKECRFGLAFNTKGTGRQILGGIDKEAFTGPLVRMTTDLRWTGSGNVAYEGKTLFKNVTIVMDSGTAGVVAPVSQVKKYFKAAGIQAVDTNVPGCVGGVFGYYACDKPPNLGFQLGSSETLFNIEPSAMKLKDNGNNNCSVWVTGLSEATLGDNFWIVGQNFMQGKYLDFDYASSSLGFANLKK